MSIKDKKQLLSPLFLKYQTEFEKNPRSRVFAPLAETYRKLGMHEKAMEILAQGIRYHPSYVMGYLGLAFCYYDLKQTNLAYSTLRPLVDNNRDNIRLQKLFADICLELNHKEEALDTYKYLLFISPRDKEIAFQVQELEKSIEGQYKPIHQPIYISEDEFSDENMLIPHENAFNVERLEVRPNASQDDFDDWKALDLNQNKKSLKVVDSGDLWSVGKQETRPRPELNLKESIEEEIEESDQNETEKIKTAMPLVTHTLVDLYCGQGHFEKALEVLEKILALNPHDQRTFKKLMEVKELVFPAEPEKVLGIESEKEEEESEEDGRKALMDIFDQQVKPVEFTAAAVPLTPDRGKILSVEKKLAQFLQKIQKRALDYRARV